MPSAIAQLLTLVILTATVAAILTTGFIKLYERKRLTLGQAATIALRSFALSSILLLVYFALGAAMNLPSGIDSVAAIVWLFVTGILITRNARSHGVEKAGWFGLGAKAMLSAFTSMWILGMAALVLIYPSA